MSKLGPIWKCFLAGKLCCCLFEKKWLKFEIEFHDSPLPESSALSSNFFTSFSGSQPSSSSSWSSESSTWKNVNKNVNKQKPLWWSLLSRRQCHSSRRRRNRQEQSIPEWLWWVWNSCSTPPWLLERWRHPFPLLAGRPGLVSCK